MKIPLYRQSLIYLIKQLRIINPVIVEVGIHRAKTSVFILKECPNCFLHMVDFWGVQPKDHPYVKTYDTLALQTLEQKEQCKKDAILRVSKFKNRFSIYCGLSHEVSKKFDNNFIDLVFLDADHSYYGLKLDLESWYRKVKLNGILCGHDYGNKRFPGVKQAVHEFAEKELIEVKSLPGFMWSIIK